MPEHKPPRSLDELDARLKDLRRGTDETGSGPRTAGSARRGAMTGMGMAFRIGTDLLAGLVVGVLVGYFMDQWLGTRPWLMILFFFLGAFAGMWNVYRTASGFGMQVGFPRTDQSEAKQDPEPGTAPKEDE